MVLVLIVGAWAIVDFRLKSRRFSESCLRDLLRYLIFFNLFQLEVFVLVYFDNNLAPPQWTAFFDWYKGVDWPFRTLLILGLQYFFFRAVFGLRGRKIPKALLPGLFLYTAAVMLWTLRSMRVSPATPPDPRLTFWNIYVWPLNILGLVWLVRLLMESRRESDPERSRTGRAFAWLFLARVPVLLVVSLGTGLFGMTVLSRLLALYTSVLPVAWLKFHFIPGADRLSKILGERTDLPSLQRSRGLSAREMEILGLMIDGRSYKDIGEVLHISVHTVKSHVYSLYRKLNVKSRPQLIHAVGVYREGPKSGVQIP